MQAFFLFGIVLSLYIDSKIVLQERFCENKKLQKVEPPRNENSTLGQRPSELRLKCLFSQMTNKNFSTSLDYLVLELSRFRYNELLDSQQYLPQVDLFCHGFNFVDDKFLKILRRLYFVVTHPKIIWKALKYVLTIIRLSLLYKKSLHALLLHFIVQGKKHEKSLNQFLPSIFIFQLF